MHGLSKRVVLWFLCVGMVIHPARPDSSEECGSDERCGGPVPTTTTSTTTTPTTTTAVVPPEETQRTTKFFEIPESRRPELQLRCQELELELDAQELNCALRCHKTLKDCFALGLDVVTKKCYGCNSPFDQSKNEIIADPIPLPAKPMSRQACYYGYEPLPGFGCAAWLDSPVTQDGAMEECRKLGGNLFTIKSEEKVPAIIGFMDTTGRQEIFWIAASVRQATHDAVWIMDNTIVEYAQWSADALSSNDTCITVNISPSQHAWQKTPCDESHAAICEQAPFL